MQDVTKKDSHALRLARLEWELHQRKVLAETCRELQNEKEKITADIKKKRDRIDNLVPMIKSILAVRYDIGFSRIVLNAMLF